MLRLSPKVQPQIRLAMQLAYIGRQLPNAFPLEMGAGKKVSST